MSTPRTRATEESEGHGKRLFWRTALATCGATRRRIRHRTSSSVASTPMARTGCGWPTSPTSRPQRGSCISRSCSTCSAAAWWAGRQPITGAPSWCSQRWTWHSNNDAQPRSSIIPTKAVMGSIRDRLVLVPCAARTPVHDTPGGRCFERCFWCMRSLRGKGARVATARLR